MHRQQMIAILEKRLPASCTVHSNKRLANYVEPEQGTQSTSSIRLEFADGTTATTDVLIGADGVRSAVRKTMFEAASRDNRDDKTDLKQYIDATFTGISVYRALIPAETLRKESPESNALKDMTIVSIYLVRCIALRSFCYTVCRKGQGNYVVFFSGFQIHLSTVSVRCHLSDCQRHYHQRCGNGIRSEFGRHALRRTLGICCDSRRAN